MEKTMFDSRATVFDGIGRKAIGAKSSSEAIKLAGLDWNVYQSDVYTYNQNGKKIAIEGKYANIRDDNNNILGIVSDRYKIIQNSEAFNFTDQLIGEGVTYETAGSLNGGKRVWMLAKLPTQYIIDEDDIETYIVFSNSHDGSTAIKIAITPIRVVCKNTLNLALKTSKRQWSAVHSTNIEKRIEEAKEVLKMSSKYMDNLKLECEELSTYKISDKKFEEILDKIVPIDEKMSDRMKTNKLLIRDDITTRYQTAPDLVDKPKTLLRMMQSITDSANHMEPIRKSVSYEDNHFMNTIDGDELIDFSYRVIRDYKI